MDQSISSILLTCLSYSDEPARKTHLQNVIAEDWLKVSELAKGHNISGLLYHKLKSLYAEEPGLQGQSGGRTLTGPHLPDYILKKLKEEFLKQAFRNTFLYRDLRELLELFQSMDIPVIVLKGAYLAEAVYENIGLRGMVDIDLLVKKEDLPRIDEELLKTGCLPLENTRNIVKRNAHFTYKLPHSALWLEIHWALAPNFVPCRVDIDGLWGRSRAVTLAQTPTRALSNEDLLLHLCLHMIRHLHEITLRMLCDIGEILRCRSTDLNRRELIDRAEEWGLVNGLYIFLSLAQELLGADLPFKVPDTLCSDNAYKQYLTFARKRIIDFSTDKSTDNIPLTMTKLWKMKGPGSKIKFLLKNTLISRREMALHYPAPSDSIRIYFYYPVWFKDLIVTYGRTLRQLVFGNKKTRDEAEEINKIIHMQEWMLS